MQLFANNVATTLSAAITTTGQTSVTLTSATNVPVPATGDWFYATICDTLDTVREIVQVTANVSGTITMVRGVDGTTAATWASGSRFELRDNVQQSRDIANAVGYSAYNAFTPAQVAHIIARDGVVDATSAIAAFFASVPAGVPIIFPSGTYKITGSTTLTRTVSGDIIFEQGALIDATGFTGGVVMLITGSRGTSYVNVAAIAAGATSITVNSTLAAILAMGSMLVVSTDSAYGGTGTLWYGGRTTYFRGELLEVKSVSGSVVQLKTAVRESYAANECAIANANCIQTRVSGLTAIGSNYQATEQDALEIAYGKNIEVESGEIDGFAHSGVYFNYCLGVKVGKLVTDAAYFSGNGTGWGICVASSQTVAISDSRLVGMRSGLNTGGREPSRDIMVNNTFLDSDGGTDASIDSRGNTDGLSLVNCTLNNGALFGGMNDRIQDSKIFIRTEPCSYSTDISGGSANGYTSGAKLTMTDNVIVCRTGASAQPAISLNVAGNMDVLDVSRNQIWQAATSSGAYIYLNNSYSTASNIAELRCDDNYGNGAPTGVHGIYLNTPITVGNMRMRRNSFTLTDGNHVLFNGASALATNVDIEENEFTSTAASSHTVSIPSAGGGAVPTFKAVYTSATTFVVTGVSVNVGDLIVVCLNMDSSWDANTTFSDTVNTYTIVQPSGGTTYSNVSLRVAYAVATTNTTLTVTSTDAGGNTSTYGMMVLVYSGMNSVQTSVLDGYVVSTVEGSSSTSHVSGTLTTSNANDLLINFFGQGDQGQTTPFFSENGQGFTVRLAAEFYGVSDQVVASTGSYHDAITTQTSTTAASFLLAFKGSGVGGAAPTTAIRFNRNRYLNAAVASFPITLAASANIECLGNTINGVGTSGAFALTAPNILYADNTKLNTSGSDVLNGRAYSRIFNAAGNVATSGASAPTAGAWLKGDICYSTAVTATTTPGWVCTTAGSPGTWTAMPVL